MLSFKIGVVLMLIGVVLWFLGRRSDRGPRVQASKGSVAVGGNNTGTISNLSRTSSGHDGHSFLTKLSILVELLGIAVIIWHTLHMAAK